MPTWSARLVLPTTRDVSASAFRSSSWIPLETCKTLWSATKLDPSFHVGFPLSQPMACRFQVTDAPITSSILPLIPWSSRSAPPGYINFYTRNSTQSDGAFSSPALNAQSSTASLQSQMSGLDLKGSGRASTDSLQNPDQQRASVANTPRTDYKLGFDSKEKSNTSLSQAPSDPNLAAYPPRKVSVRRSGSNRSGAVASGASTPPVGGVPTQQQQQQQPPAQQFSKAPQETDSVSELQEFEGEEDLYFDYDPYDLSVPKQVICWGEFPNSSILCLRCTFYANFRHSFSSVRVNYEYVPQAKEELHIKKGMSIPVVQQQEDGWWEGEVDDGQGRRRRGLFPSNFASIIPTPAV